MNNRTRIVTPYLRILSLVVLFIFSSSPVVAQVPVPVDANGNPLASTSSELLANSAIDTVLQPFTNAELEQFVGPIALYPDNLLAIILPASAYPLQIVLAARFLEQLKTDSSLQPDESWDESIIALLNYPEVVQMMNENIQWTWQLGEAVVNQETDVLAAIGVFRDRAYTAGNLETDEFQNVTNSGETITITQVEETVVYVPYYVPEEVVIYQTRPVYHYYPTAYPVYYYPYPANYRFRSGFFWGVTTAFNIGWHDHHLHVYHPSYSRHPYYGRNYDSSHHYRRPNLGAFNNFYVDNSYRRSGDRNRDGSYWRVQGNSGARPGDRRDRYQNYSSGNAATAVAGNRANRGNGGNRDNNRENNGQNNRENDRENNSGNNSANRANRGLTVNNSNRAAVDNTAASIGLAENDPATTATPFRVPRNERQGNTDVNGNRGAGRDGPNRSAIVNNNPELTTRNADNSSSNRRRDRIERQLSSQSGLNSVEQRSGRRASSASTPSRQANAFSAPRQDTSSRNNSERARNQGNRGQAAAASDSGSRRTRQEPTRQSATRAPERAESSGRSEPARERRAAAAPERSRSTSRVRDRGLTREP